jgi:hypothetical protein
MQLFAVEHTYTTMPATASFLKKVGGRVDGELEMQLFAVKSNAYFR